MEKENKKVINEYDENDLDIKKKYLYQITAIIRFLDYKIKREVQYRKEKATKLRDELDYYWRDTNLLGYFDEISDMPRGTDKGSSPVERLVMNKVRMEETLNTFQGETDGKGSTDGKIEIDMDDVYGYVFTTVERECGLYPVVFNEVMDVIHSVKNLQGVIMLEDRYIRGLEMKAIVMESNMRSSSAYKFMNDIISSIEIPEAQHYREWIEW